MREELYKLYTNYLFLSRTKSAKECNDYLTSVLKVLLKDRKRLDYLNSNNFYIAASTIINESFKEKNIEEGFKRFEFHIKGMFE